MGLFDGRNKSGMVEVTMTTVGPVGDIGGGAQVKVCADTVRKAVVIKTIALERVLPFEKITKAIFTTSTEIEQKSKSVGGRAMIGGVLLGPVGAIVGGMSGIGKKEKKKIRSYVIINYTSGGEDKVASFLAPSVGDPRCSNLVKDITAELPKEIIPATSEL